MISFEGFTSTSSQVSAVIVDSIMHRGAITLDGAASVRDAALVMRAKGVGSVVVLVGGVPTGIVTERDVAFRVVAERMDPDATRLDQVMSKPLATIEPSASVEEAAARMKQLRLKRLVVVLGSEVRGIVSTTDIAYAEPELTRSLVEGWVKQRWDG